MRKITLMGFALALTLLALPGFAADSAETAVDTVTLDQLFTEEAAPEAGEVTPSTDAPASAEGQEPLFLVGGESCGGVTCGKGEYCCNASCAWCRPYGVSCIQIACN